MRIEGEKTDINGVCLEDYLDYPGESGPTKLLELKSDALEGQDHPGSEHERALLHPNRGSSGHSSYAFPYSSLESAEGVQATWPAGRPNPVSLDRPQEPSRSSLPSKYLHLYSTRPSTLLELGDGGGLNQPLSDLTAARAMISHVLGPPALLVMKGE